MNCVFSQIMNIFSTFPAGCTVNNCMQCNYPNKCEVCKAGYSGSECEGECLCLKSNLRLSITVTSWWARWRLKSQPHDCLLSRLFRRRSKKTSKLRFTGLCEGNSPVTGEFPHKGPVTRKTFPFDDVIVTNVINNSSCACKLKLS